MNLIMEMTIYGSDSEELIVELQEAIDTLKQMNLPEMVTEKDVEIETCNAIISITETD